MVFAFLQEVTAITWQIEILQDDKKKETEVIAGSKATGADRKDARVAGGGDAGNKVRNVDSAEKRNQLEQIKHLAQMLQDQQALLKKLTESMQSAPN